MEQFKVTLMNDQGGSGSEFPLLVLSMLTNTILPLFIALITIDSFSGCTIWLKIPTGYLAGRNYLKIYGDLTP